MRAGEFDRLAAAVPEHEAAVEGEFVALGVAAEIVVVVEDEDAGGWPGGAAVEPGGRKPADAGTDHDEIVALLDRRAAEPDSARGRTRSACAASNEPACWPRSPVSAGG